MNIKTRFLTALIFAVFVSPLAAIDYISYVGAEVDNAARWLTVTDSTMDKSLLTTGTVYGNALAVDWKNQGAGALGGGVSLHSRANVDTGNGRLIDNPLSTDNPIGTVISGFITNAAVNNGFTITFTQDFINTYGTSARVGIMYDVLRDGYVPDGSSQQEEISVQIMGNTVSRVSAWSAIENREPDIYFFDVVGIKANESISLLFTDKNFTNHQPYLGPLSVDPIPARGAGSGTWKLDFTDSSAANYLDTTKVMPSRALTDSTGAMTSAVARLDGTSAGTYDSLSLAGLNRGSVFVLSSDNDAAKTQFFVTNAKGEISGTFGSESNSLFSLSLGNDFLQKADSLSITKVEPLMVVSVDLQSTLGTRMSGADPVAGLGNVWNVYDFANWKGGTDATKPGTEGYKSAPLVDSDGNATAIYFSTDSKVDSNGNRVPQTLVGWPDRVGGGGTSPLFGDYLFGNNEGVLLTTSALNWEIGGLEAGDLYQLIMFGAQGRVADITVFDEINGNELQTAPANGAAYYYVYADEFGRIMGAFGNDGASNEQNWSGFHLVGYGSLPSSAVPEPSTWLMMLMAVAFGGVAVWRKKSRGGVGDPT